MPRKSRKELVDVDEDEAQIAREALYRRMERELHLLWKESHVRSPRS